MIEMASQGKEGQGRQKALPVPAHGKASLSVPLIIGSSFSLLGPPRRRGALPGVHFAWCCCSLSPENSLWRHSGLNFRVEGWEGAQSSHLGDLVHLPSISGQGGDAPGGGEGAALGIPGQEGASWPSLCQLLCEDTCTSPPPAPPKFPSTSGKEPRMPPACAAPAACPQPCAPHRGVGAAVSPSPRCRRDGTGRVSYLPA